MFHPHSSLLGHTGNTSSSDKTNTSLAAPESFSGARELAPGMRNHRVSFLQCKMDWRWVILTIYVQVDAVMPCSDTEVSAVALRHLIMNHRWIKHRQASWSSPFYNMLPYVKKHRNADLENLSSTVTLTIMKIITVPLQLFRKPRH